MERILQIRETVNYSRFFFLSGINRPVGASHVSKLRESIRTLGVLRPIIVATTNLIDGVTREYIIDGQHLFNALMGLELPVPYVKINVSSQQDIVKSIALLNASSKSWCMVDYIRAWSLLKPSYRKIMSVYNQHNLTIISIAAIAMNTVERSSLARMVKKGLIEIRNHRFDEIVKYSSEIIDALEVKPTGFTKERITVAFLRYINNIQTYNHNVIMQRISEHREKIIQSFGEEELLYEILQEFIFC